MNSEIGNKNLRDSYSPFSLLIICIKYIGKNMKIYENEECFPVLPKHLKAEIVRYIMVCVQDIHIPSFQKLLNDQVYGLNLISFNVNDNLLNGISTKCPKLRALYIKGNSNNLTKNGLQQISKLKNLEQLEIRNCGFVDDDLIKLITQFCKSLYLLSIPGSQITDECFHFLKEMKIRNLNISRTKITDEFMKNLSKSDMAKNLYELSVNNNFNVTNVGLFHLPWKRLRYVSFHGCNIDATVFDYIRLSATKYMKWSLPH